jgi:hypothetical protein
LKVRIDVNVSGPRPVSGRFTILELADQQDIAYSQSWKFVRFLAEFRFHCLNEGAICISSTFVATAKWRRPVACDMWQAISLLDAAPLVTTGENTFERGSHLPGGSSPPTTDTAATRSTTAQ